MVAQPSNSRVYSPTRRSHRETLAGQPLIPGLRLERTFAKDDWILRGEFHAHQSSKASCPLRQMVLPAEQCLFFRCRVRQRKPMMTIVIRSIGQTGNHGYSKHCWLLLLCYSSQSLGSSAIQNGHCPASYNISWSSFKSPHFAVSLRGPRARGLP